MHGTTTQGETRSPGMPPPPRRGAGPTRVLRSCYYWSEAGEQPECNVAAWVLSSSAASVVSLCWCRWS